MVNVSSELASLQTLVTTKQKDFDELMSSYIQNNIRLKDEMDDVKKRITVLIDRENPE